MCTSHLLKYIKIPQDAKQNLSSGSKMCQQLNGTWKHYQKNLRGGKKTFSPLTDYGLINENELQLWKLPGELQARQPKQIIQYKFQNDVYIILLTVKPLGMKLAFFKVSLGNCVCYFKAWGQSMSKNLERKIFFVFIFRIWVMVGND